MGRHKIDIKYKSLNLPPNPFKGWFSGDMLPFDTMKVSKDK